MRPVIFLFVLAMLILSSCTQPRYVYNQPARNLHYFTEANQLKLTGSWATGPSRSDGSTDKKYNNGYDFQGAYALSHHWAVMGSFYNRKEQDVIKHPDRSLPRSSTITYKRSGYEIAGSYFRPFDPGKSSFFCIDGGLGFAKNSHEDYGTIFDSLGMTRNYQNNMSRFFIQPGVYTGPGAFQAGMGLRLQWQFFNNVKTTYTPQELTVFSLNGLHEMFSIEPYFSLRFSPKSIPMVKAEVQFSFATASSGYYVRRGYLSLGFTVYPLYHKQTW